MAKSGRLGSKGVRRGPRRDEVRRKLDVGVTLGAMDVVVGALPSALVSEVDMIDVGVRVGVAVVLTSGSLSGGVLGEQSSSS